MGEHVAENNSGRSRAASVRAREDYYLRDTIVTMHASVAKALPVAIIITSSGKFSSTGRGLQRRRGQA